MKFEAQEEYERAKLGGDGSDAGTDVGMSINFKRGVEMGSEGQKRKRRMDNEDMVGDDRSYPS